LGTTEFPIQKWKFFRKIKEIKGLCGDVLQYLAQGILKIDAEIAEKGHLWMETS